MRFRLTLLSLALPLAACRGAAPSELAPAPVVSVASPASSPQDPASADAPPPHGWLVGVLWDEAARHCLPSGQERWTDEHFEVGFVRLAPAPAGIAHLRKRPVVVRGLPDPGFRPPPGPDTSDCPIAQMRSDWVDSKHGFRVLRSASRPAGAFAASRVEPFEGLQVSRAGDSLQVRLTNTLPVALHDVAIVLHYEGCYGKPGSSERRESLGTLQAGQTHAASFPVLDSAVSNRPERQPHRADSVEVRAGRQDNVWFDLDWSLSAAGVSVRCPNGNP